MKKQTKRTAHNRKFTHSFGLFDVTMIPAQIDAIYFGDMACLAVSKDEYMAQVKRPAGATLLACKAVVEHYGVMLDHPNRDKDNWEAVLWIAAWQIKDNQDN